MNTTSSNDASASTEQTDDKPSGCPISKENRTPTGCPISREAAQFDPFDSPYQISPADALRWFRDKEPVFYSPKLGYWVVTRYEDVKAVFRDNETFSPSIALERLVPPSQDALDILKKYDYGMDRTLVNEDEPQHMERRRAVMSYFRPEELAKHRPDVQKLTTQYIDRFIDKGKADLVDEMLWEIPLSVALHFLGIPEEDMDTLREFSVAHTLNTWGRPTPEQQLEIAESVGKFWQYSGQVLKKMQADPSGYGWMPYTIRQQKEFPDAITDSYLHSMMMAIIGAAHETTANSTSNAMRMLLTHRDAWQQLCENPALIPNAVEECLRYEGAIVAWRRNATIDTKIGGIDIPKDGKILIVSVSGNHDERQFENPDVLDIFRDNTSEHLTFGYGSHQCLGKNIGRMEMCVFIEEFTRRLPHMEIVPNQDFKLLPNISFRAPDHLWVDWEPEKNPERINPEILDQRLSFPVGPPVKDDIARQARVLEITSEAEGVIHLVLEDAHGHLFPNWSAGSHIDLLVGEFERKYSLCGNAEDTSTYEIAVLKEDDGRGGSIYIHDNIKVGMDIRIRGPKNHFHMDESGQHYVLIAGGIGITPILAMADRLKRIGKSYEIHYGGSATSTMAYIKRLQNDHGDALHLYAKKSGNRMDLDSILKKPKDGVKIYACGPDRLLEHLDVLSENWADGTLHYEHFSSATSQLNPDEEHAFTAVLTDSDVSIEVASDQTLLQALTAAGVDVQRDCEEGLCGSCEVKVIEGEIDHRDKVLSKSERAEGKRLMSCCSRANGNTIKLAL